MTALRHRLIILALAALLPLIILAAGLTIYSLRHQQEHLKEEAVLHATDVLNSAERDLFAQVDILRGLSRSRNLDGASPNLEGFRSEAIHFTDELPHWDKVILADRDGRQLVNTGVPSGTPLPGVVDETSYRRVLTTGQPDIEGVSGPLSGDRLPRVTVRVPVSREGSIRYVLTVVLLPNVLSDLAAEGLQPGWLAFLVDREGRIAASARQPEGIGQRPSEQTLSARDAGTSGVYEGVTRNGVPTVTAFRRSERIGWSAHVSIPRALFNAPLVRSMWILAAASAGVLVFVTLFIRLLRNEALAQEQSAALLAATLENMDQGLMMFDASDTILVYNRRVLELLDLPAALMAGRPTFKAVRRYQLDRGEFTRSEERFRQWVEESGLDNRPRTYERERPDGTVLEVRTVPLSGGGAVRTFTDITARRQAEAGLRRSEERYRLVAMATNDVVWDADIDRDEVLWSENAPRLFRYAPGDVEPTGTWWRERVHPEDRARVLARVQEVFDNGEDSWSQEYRFRRGDDTWAHVLDRGYVQRDAEGRPIRYMGAMQDITERRQLEAQFRQAQKMEAVGQLTGGVAHDFNNLLTVILGNAEVLAESSRDPDFQALARMIEAAASSGAELTQKLLAFGRRQSLKPEPIALADVVRGMRGIFERTLGEQIEVATHLPEVKSAALADRTLLESAILNLVVNARDAMPQGGRLTLATGARLATADDGPIPAGEPVVFVTVSDTGTGMSPEVLARAFEPFFTTKGVGEGSGLGLAMVYGFVEQSGGHVSIESQPGQGTSVTIVFRAVDRAPEQATEVPRPHVEAGRERVLVVEDEPSVRQFVLSQLGTLGYDTTAVAAARDALHLLGQGRPFDLLFTDVVLPHGISGVELAQQAKAARPDLKVLLTSGYPEEVFDHHGGPAEGTLLLRKPYKRRELAETIRKALES